MHPTDQPTNRAEKETNDQLRAAWQYGYCE